MIVSLNQKFGELKLVHRFAVHSLVKETRKPVSESISANDASNSPSTGDPFEVMKRHCNFIILQHK